jgi:hypothetical protein
VRTMPQNLLRDASFENSLLPARAADTRHSEIVPRAVVRPEELSYHLLSPKNAGPADVLLLGEAYRCWGEVWKDAFRELDNLQDLRSDDFSRQDEVGALFHGYECIGLSFFRWADLQSPVVRADSYFAPWPATAIDKAAVHGTSGCISSYFTIAAPWRRASGCSLKDVLVSLIIERFLVSDADVLVGTLRNNRGINSMCYRNGFQSIEKDLVFHGVDVDLTAFYRATCVRPPTSDVDERIVQSIRPQHLSLVRSA